MLSINGNTRFHTNYAKNSGGESAVVFQATFGISLEEWRVIHREVDAVNGNVGLYALHSSRMKYHVLIVISS